MTDNESSSTTVTLLYQVGATLNEALSNSDTTAITLSATTSLPASGTIFIDDEQISYTSISGNDLAGTIARGVSNTTAATHNSGTTIWIKVVTVSGATGSVANGTGKSITWTAPTDLSNYYSASATVRVVANDGASSNQVGSATSASYTLDIKVPTSPSISIASAAATTTSYTVTLTLSATDDTMSSGVSGQMKISNSSDLAADGLNADSGNWITYNTSVASWTLTTGDGTKTVYVQFKDAKSNTTSTVNDTIVKISPPAVSNVTASQDANGFVTVAYDVTDAVQSSTTISLYYKAIGTLNETLSNSDTVAITISDATLFPTSGTILIDSEIITYTSKSSNDLGGTITRGAGYTTAASHTSGAAVFVKAATVSGNAGASVANGTGKSITWTAKTDVNGYYGATSTVTVVSDDAHDIGSAASANYALDTKDPTLGAVPIKVDGSVSPSALTLSASDDTTLQMKIGVASDLSDGSYVSYATSATQPLATDPDTVYVQYKDAKGNTTAIQSAATPDKPTNVMIQDTSNTTISPAEYRLFVAWKTMTAPATGFGSYKVYRSTDQSSWTLLSTITDRTTNYYGDNAAAQNTRYYYRVTMLDTPGSVSYNSSTVNGAADGVQDYGEGGGGTLPGPAISSVASSNVRTTTATITWNTDTLSNSTVGYSTTSAVFTNTTGLTSMANTAAGVGAHSVTLSGLSTNTAYYYRVQSADSNSTTTTDNNGGPGYTFTTLAGPVISGVSTRSVDNTSATIEWTTSTAANSYVVYSTSPTLATSSTVGSDATGTAHTVTLTNLTQGTKYYYYVRSTDGSSVQARDENVVNGEIKYFSFTTSSDTIAPVINPIASSPTVTTAVITWTTDELSDTQVEYGLTNAYGSSTTLDSTKTIQHNVTLSSLTAGTVYHFRVKSRDGNSNLATSADQTFTTTQAADTTPPVISARATSGIALTQATITWTTDEAADSFVNYGTSNAFGTTRGTANRVTYHSVTITGLTGNTAYYYAILTEDAAGNRRTDDNSGAGYTFTTVADTAPPVFATAPAVTSISDTTAVVSWTTDEDSTSQVFYGPTTGTYPSSNQIDATMTKQHSMAVSGLSYQTTYYLVAKSKDASDNLGTSSQVSFTTLEQQFAASQRVMRTTVVERQLPGVPEDKYKSVVGESETLSKRLAASEKARSALEKELSELKNKILGLEQKSNETNSPIEIVSIVGKKFVELTKSIGESITVSTVENVARRPQTIEEQRRLESEIGPTLTSLRELAKYIPPPQLKTTPTIEISSTEATISWETDKPATGIVRYAEDRAFVEAVGTKEPYTNQAGSADEYKIAHTVVLKGLLPSTTYHYSLLSESEASARALSPDFTFLTRSELPMISSQKLERLSDTAVKIAWKTNIQTNSLVTYTPLDGNQPKTAESKSEGRPEFTREHEVTVTNLLPATRYEIQISSEDPFKNVANLTLEPYRTTEDKTPPDVSQIKTTLSIFPGTTNRVQTIVSWKTDEPATTKVIFDKGAPQGEEEEQTFSAETEENKELTVNHIVILTTWAPGEIYRFRTVSTDASGNTQVSKTFAVLTPRPKATVVDLIFTNFSDVFGWTQKLPGAK